MRIHWRLNMPLVDGIEAAIVLRELLPQLRLALYSGDTDVHRERAHDLGLPLFDKSDLDRATQWIISASGGIARPFGLASAAAEVEPRRHGGGEPASKVPASDRRPHVESRLIPCESSRGVAQPG